MIDLKRNSYYKPVFMNIIYRTLLLCLFCILTQTIYSQSILINSDGGTPDTSAILELRSTEKGFLTPRMEASDRLGISSPAEGLMVYQTNGTKGFYYYNGTGWDTLGGANTVNFISNVTTITNSKITLISDIKAANTDGGTFPNGAWRTRDLNTIKGDLSSVSLQNDTIILQPGVYSITATAPAFEVNEHQIRLLNITSNTVDGFGIMAFSDKFASSSSSLSAIVNVASTSKFFLQHRCSDTQNNTGFGISSSWSESVYTQVRIQKL